MSVYFITCRAQGICKIGYASNPKTRRSSLQTAFAADLVLEATLPGGVDLEREFHRRFADQRVRGEWFKLDGLLEEVIKTAAASETTVNENNIPAVRQTDEELAEQSIIIANALLAEHERAFAGVAYPPVVGLPPSRPFFIPTSAGGGQFNDHFAIRDGDGFIICSEMNLTWGQADRLCDVLDVVRQRALDLNLTSQREPR